MLLQTLIFNIYSQTRELFSYKDCSLKFVDFKNVLLNFVRVELHNCSFLLPLGGKTNTYFLLFAVFVFFKMILIGIF